jgi:hypothetical protein
MKKYPLIVALFVFACGTLAFGQDQIVYTDPAVQHLSTDVPGDDMGLNFTVNEGITVDALGAFNAAGNGVITGYIQVAIYDFSTGQWVTPDVTFHGTYTPEGAGYDVFQSITPVYLPPGNYQIDAVGFQEGDPAGNQYYRSTGPTPNDLEGALTFTGASYAFVGVLAPETSCGGCNPLPQQISQFDAGTFEAHVPESGAPSLYLLLTGICCFGAIFASRKQLGARA